MYHFLIRKFLFVCFTVLWAMSVSMFEQYIQLSPGFPFEMPKITLHLLRDACSTGFRLVASWLCVYTSENVRKGVRIPLVLSADVFRRSKIVYKLCSSCAEHADAEAHSITFVLGIRSSDWD